RRDLGGLPRPVETCRQRPLPGRSDRVDVEVDRRWLAAQWRFVKDHLPAAPARVLELGCGPRGGLVPALRNDRYTAVGVDPEAPDEPGYHRVGFEDYRPPQPVDAVVACTSLHHVADLDRVLDLIHDALTPAACWSWWSGPGNASTSPPPGGASPASARPATMRTRVGCIGTRPAGPTPACRGRGICGPGPTRRACTPGNGSSPPWTPGSTAGCASAGRTSSPTWPTPRRLTISPPSTPGPFR